MGLFCQNNIQKQVFWALDHVPVVNSDSMMTDCEHCFSLGICVLVEPESVSHWTPCKYAECIFQQEIMIYPHP